MRKTEGNRALLKQVLGISKNYSEKRAKAAHTGIFQYDLKLAVGYTVMVTTNVDVDGGIVNGLRGKVTSLSKDCIKMQCGGKTFEIVPLTRTWGSMSVTQFPLRLAWAITVHKAQGLTLNKGLIDLSKCRSFGQVYTALSRFRSLEDVEIKNGIHPGLVWAHPMALNYYKLHLSKPSKLCLPLDDIVAVADIIGDRCKLQGTIRKLWGNNYLLSCSIKPNKSHSTFKFWYKHPIPVSSLHQVTCTTFVRSDTKGNFPEKCQHTFWSSKVIIHPIDNAAPSSREVFIRDHDDTRLNLHFRVSFTGCIRKQTSNRKIMTVSLFEGGEIELFRQTNAALVQIPFEKGKQYEFSKIISCGVDNRLRMDAASEVDSSVHVRNGRRDRCSSVSAAIYALYRAGVFAEVISSPKDVRDAWISPLLLIAGDDEFPSEDSFVLAARGVQNKVNEFFDSVLSAVTEGRMAPNGAALVAPEIPAIRLGSGVDFYTKKYGVRAKLAQTAATRLHETLGFCLKHKYTQTFSSQAKFILLEIFSEGFGNDMMNDFFAYNMFEAIVEYTSIVALQHADLLEQEGLQVEIFTLLALVKSFMPELYDEEQQFWSLWCKNNPLRAAVKYSIPIKTCKPLLLLPRHLIDIRQKEFESRIKSLRNSANELFRENLQGIQRFEEIVTYFSAVEETASISTAKLSIVVATSDIVQSLVALTIGEAVSVDSGGFLVQLKLAGDTPVRCIIGNMEWFSANPHAFRQLVLVFVEPVSMPASAEFGCHLVTNIVDTRGAELQNIPLLRFRSSGQDNGIVLCSNIHVKEGKDQNPRLLPSGCSWGIDQSISQAQIGQFCRDKHEYKTWMMWAIKRRDGGDTTPVKCIVEKLKELPLLGPKASFDQLLEESRSCDRVFDSLSSLRIGTFNISVFDWQKMEKDDLLVDEVIIKNRFAVLALQELTKPKKSIASEETFAQRVEKDRGDGKKLKFYTAREHTGGGSLLEFPSLIIDENLVSPASSGDDWHDYIKHDLLDYDYKNDEDVHPRVPYFWRLQVKESKSTFVVVSVHQPPNPGKVMKRVRLNFMKGLSDFIEQTWPKQDVFIVGDFNLDNANELEYKGFKSLLPDDAKTNTSRTKPYDHILVRSNLRFNDAAQAVVVDLKDIIKGLIDDATQNNCTERATELKNMLKNDKILKKMVSDHCPVYAEYTGWKKSRLIDPGSMLMASFK